MIKRTIVGLIILLVLSTSNLHAYDNKETHPLLTRKSIENSMIDNYLRSRLGFTSGIDTNIRNNEWTSAIEDNSIWKSNPKTVFDWLRYGSFKEDTPMCRAFNHFHNPLEEWERSYLTDDASTRDGYKLRYVCGKETGLLGDYPFRAEAFSNHMGDGIYIKRQSDRSKSQAGYGLV